MKKNLFRFIVLLALTLFVPSAVTWAEEAQEIETVLSDGTEVLENARFEEGMEASEDEGEAFEDEAEALEDEGGVFEDEGEAFEEDDLLTSNASIVNEGNSDGELEITMDLTADDGTPLFAHDITFYVGLFETDEAGDENLVVIEPVSFRDSCSGSVVISGLDTQRRYHVNVVDEYGAIVDVGTIGDSTYVSNYWNGNEVLFPEYEANVRADVSIEFLEIPDGFYKTGEIAITKKCLGSDGKAKKSTLTFYAGIFADRECTILSDQVAANILELAMDGHSSVTVSTMVEIPESDFSLYIAEVDEDGNPVSLDGQFLRRYQVSYSDSSIVFDTDSLSKSVTITNRERPVVPVLSISKKAVTLYTKGSTKTTLKASLKNGKGTIKFKTSNKKVATVSSKGVVTAKKAGKAVITAYVKINGKTYAADCTVTVKKPTLSVNKTSVTLTEGKTFTIVSKAVPSGKVTYTSSSKKIATVNSKGIVTAKKKGKATITVKANGISKKVKIVVKAKPKAVSTKTKRSSGSSSSSSSSYVYVAGSGKKYHTTNHCGNMNPNKAVRMTLQQAKSRGYTACKNCH